MRQMTLYIVMIMCLACMCVSVNAQSLVTIDSLVLWPDSIKHEKDVALRLGVGGVYITNETCLIAIRSGIIQKTSEDAFWSILKECQPTRGSWWDNYQSALSNGSLFWPQSIFQIHGKEEFILFDRYIHSPYRMIVSSGFNTKTSLLKEPDSLAIINDIAVYNDHIYYAIYSSTHDTVLCVSDIGGSNYEGIYTIPESVSSFLDLVGADNSSVIAYDLTNNTIWVGLKYFNKIYNVNKTGMLIDSIVINAIDHKVPKPPKSRIKSPAMHTDWTKSNTPLCKFDYAYPEYILLQYWTDWVKQGVDSVRLSPTLIWKTDKTPVELNIDKTWRLVQTLPDGRIIFAKYHRINGKTNKVVVYITRIES
ncbi:MAG: hypothetical protein KAR42_13590 [candidate division Zixibacteria bacterium]|nr:hypothetical protein [candidate division Zixibacteria bacterium]